MAADSLQMQRLMPLRPARALRYRGRALSEGRSCDGVLRTAAIPRAARQDGRVGQDHGGGDHPVPGVEGHGDLRQLQGRDRRVRFDSEAEREALYKAVYDTDHWKTKIAPRVPECLDRDKIVVTRIVATAKSAMR